MITPRTVFVFTLAFVTACGLTAGLFLAMAVPFAWLWNAVPAVLFKLPPLRYWQAVGLLALVKLVAAAAEGVKMSFKWSESN